MIAKIYDIYYLAKKMLYIIYFYCIWTILVISIYIVYHINIHKKNSYYLWQYIYYILKNSITYVKGYHS